jgi:phospholipase C
MLNRKRVLVCVVLLGISTFAAFAQVPNNSSSITNPNSASSGSTVAEYFTVSPNISAPGQFVEFSWRVSNADGFSVTPGLLSDEEDGALAPSAAHYMQVAPAASVTFRGVAIGSKSPQMSQPMSAALTIVPLKLRASAHEVSAGQPAVLTFSGPNNGSSLFLTVLPENSTIRVTPDFCGGLTCTGSYMTGPMGSTKTFMLGATGPRQGQAYSEAIPVNVAGGMTLSCAATPTVPASGQAVTITWKSTNAVSVRINQGVGEVSPATSGNIVVHPTQSTSYTCTATDRFGDHLSGQAKVTLSTGDVTNLNHIVYMLQENRSFDNYFGNLAYYRVNVDQVPGAQMSDVNDLHNLSPGYTLQNPQGQSIPPYHQRTECIEGLNPNWNQSHMDMDLVGGDWLHLSSNSQFLMDSFLFTTGSSQYDPSDSRPLGYYDWTDLPFYYELATQFNTSDTFYSPTSDATAINRMYLFAATSYGDIFPPGSNNLTWTRPTIFRLLTGAGISWRYYYQDNSVFLAQWADWNNPQIQGNVRNIQEWYNILASPSADHDLPQVVFIERASATNLDEHPGNNIQNGAAMVQQIMSPLLTSTAWPDSVFILSYDEAGGTYDHQAPILVTPPDDKVPLSFQSQPFTHGLFNVTGFRVPVILVSPWSKPHTVWHMPTDYTSILKLIETRFNLTPMTHRDRSAGDLTDPTNGPFDFSSPQMLQVPPLPTQPTNGTCNYQLEGYAP